jgi:ABC-type sugar transport system substrate-binding protein
LLTRNVDVLVMGIYQTESESRATAQKAQAQGVKTVGFATYVYNSPNVVEDQFRTALTLGDFVIDKLQRQGTVVQTAENPGFYQPFDIEVSTLDLMVHWQSRMKMLPFMPGGVSTQNERQLARENVSRLLAANPAKGSVNAVVSWWWPDTLGAQDALHQAGRTEVLLANHYFSNELLTAMSRPDTLIAASTDTPWHIIGTTTADLAVALAHGQSLPPATHFVPVTFIEKKDAAKALAEVQSMDTEVIALLSKYGG